MKNDNFEVSGLFKNEPITVENDEDAEEENEGINFIAGGKLPPELQEILNRFLGGDEDNDGDGCEACESENEDVIESVTNGLKQSINQLFNIVLGPSNGNNTGIGKKSKKEFPLKKWKKLTDPENFSAFLCQKSRNLKEEFYDTFEKKEEYPLSLFADIIVNAEIEGCEFNAEDRFVIYESTEKYILGSVIPVEEHLCSYYIAFYKDENNAWNIIIPIYGNSYDPETGEAISFEEHPEWFNPNTGDFLFSDIEKVHLGLDMALTPVKNTLFAPVQFGEIQNGQRPITANSEYLYIGRIKPNGSTESDLFKRDNGLDSEKDSFDLYIKFDKEIHSDDLQALSDWFLGINWNETFLMKNTELYARSDDMLYILLETPEGFNNLSEWKHE